MNKQLAVLNLPVAGSVSLVCRLGLKQSQRALSPIAGEVELENTSAMAMEIQVKSSPLQYLSLLVVDASGRVISESFYGDLFSPLVKPYSLRLEPGEKYTGPVHLLGNVPKEKQQPGVYTVQAVYQYKQLKAVSEPLRVELPSQCGR